MELNDVISWCKKNGYKLCDNLEVDCCCNITHLGEAKGYKGRTFQICTNCYTTQCPVCHEYCDDSYQDECYDCKGECIYDDVVCDYRVKYRLRLRKDDLFVEKIIESHNKIKEKEYEWHKDSYFVDAILEYYGEKRKRPKESEYYDSIVEYCLDTADKEIEEQ